MKHRAMRFALSLPGWLLLLAVALIGLGAILQGCQPADEQIAMKEEKYVRDSYGTTIYTVSYAGHRYVLAWVSRGVGICHAGDCPCRTNSVWRCSGEAR